jgi:hypothetical protein
MATSQTTPSTFIFWKAAFLVEVLPYWATTLGQLLPLGAHVSEQSPPCRMVLRYPA